MKKKAAALKYEEGNTAPIVTAQGVGVVAEKILESAKDSDVPVVYNRELANLLTNVDVGDQIPDELYLAVAEVLAYVMEVDSSKGR